MYHDVASQVEDFVVLFEFWKEGEATEEEVKEAFEKANTAIDILLSYFTAYIPFTSITLVRARQPRLAFD